MVQGLFQGSLHLRGQQTNDESVRVITVKLESRSRGPEVPRGHDICREIFWYLNNHEILSVAKPLIGLIFVSAQELPIETRILLQGALELLTAINCASTECSRFVMVNNSNLDFVGVRVQVPVGVKINATIEQRNNKNKD